jgi:hypothetical protein
MVVACARPIVVAVAVNNSTSNITAVGMTLVEKEDHVTQKDITQQSSRVVSTRTVKWPNRIKS